MTRFELLSIVGTAIALLIASVSLYKSWVHSKKMLELESINSQLSEKQLSIIKESEPLEGQPVFVLRTSRILGRGTYGTREYQVYISFFVDKSGHDYLDPHHLTFVSLRDGVFKSAVVVGVHEAPESFAAGCEILREHTFAVKPDSSLDECKIHIAYTDKTGVKRTQQFGIFAEGQKGPVPLSVTYKLEKIYQLKPSSHLWSI